jgi:tRNA U34 5-methylaminomethyl-2-thiouridine-forming methyltransferase MnmC
VTDDESRTLVDPQTQVAYHSASGAVAETRHVYLENSGVAERLSAGRPTTVLEVGLGTGLGMLLTLDAARVAKTSLHYTALEYEWLEAGVLRQLKMGKELCDPPLATRFLHWRESLGETVPDGRYHWHAAGEQSINVHVIDALQWNEDVSTVFDAIYFDPFAPDKNPELWQPRFLARMHRVLSNDGRLVSYCVNRKVRDDFATAGFQVRRVPGPKGGKREVMVATK